MVVVGKYFVFFEEYVCCFELVLVGIYDVLWLIMFRLGGDFLVGEIDVWWSDCICEFLGYL